MLTATLTLPVPFAIHAGHGDFLGYICGARVLYARACRFRYLCARRHGSIRAALFVLRLLLRTAPVADIFACPIFTRMAALVISINIHVLALVCRTGDSGLGVSVEWVGVCGVTWSPGLAGSRGTGSFSLSPLFPLTFYLFPLVCSALFPPPLFPLFHLLSFYLSLSFSLSSPLFSPKGSMACACFRQGGWMEQDDGTCVMVVSGVRAVWCSATLLQHSSCHLLILRLLFSNMSFLVRHPSSMPVFHFSEGLGRQTGWQEAFSSVLHGAISQVFPNKNRHSSMTAWMRQEQWTDRTKTCNVFGKTFYYYYF